MKYTAILFNPFTTDYIIEYPADTVEAVWALVDKHPEDSPYKIAAIVAYNRMAYYTVAPIIEACKDFEQLKGMTVFTAQHWLSSADNADYINNVITGGNLSFTMNEQEVAAYIKNNDVALVRTKIGNINTSALCKIDKKPDGSLNIVPLALLVTPELFQQITPIYSLDENA